MTPAADAVSTTSTTATGQPPTTESDAQTRTPRGAGGWRIVVVLSLVAILGIVMTLVTISALATQRPRLKPFGVTGPSPVVTAAQSAKLKGYQISFANRLYANEKDVTGGTGSPLNPLAIL